MDDVRSAFPAAVDEQRKNRLARWIGDELKLTGGGQFLHPVERRAVGGYKLVHINERLRVGQMHLLQLRCACR
jgi:hypothetical protein